MNPSRVFNALRDHAVSYLLIGGLNFAMNHRPDYLTYDIDLFVEDVPENLAKLNQTLKYLEATWGPNDASWGPIPDDQGRWLCGQACFCLLTSAGPVDIFRCVQGLEGRYQECYNASLERRTAEGVVYRSLSDRHMLDCQMALNENDRKLDRVRHLRNILKS